MDRRYKTLTKNTLVFAFGVFGSKFITFFLVPLYTNVLTTSEYGVADLITTISGLLLPLFSLALGESILYFGIRSKTDEERERYFKTGFVAVLCSCFSLVVLSPLFLLYESIHEFVPFLVFYSILEIIRNYLRFYTKSSDKNLLYSVDNIIYAVVVAALNVLFLLVLKCGITGYLLSFIAAELTSTIFLFLSNRCGRIMIKYRFNKQTAKLMILYSLPLILNSISWTIANSSDKIMLEALISSDSVGLYTAASKLPTILSTVVGLFCQAWTLSAYLEIDNKDSSFYSKIFTSFSAVLFLASAIALTFARPFMSVYVGKDFADSASYVPFLIIATVFQSFGTYFGSIIQSGKKNVFMLVSTVSAAVINLIANYLLILLLGIQGACISTALSFFVVFAIRLIFSKKIISFPISTAKLLISMSVLVALSFFVAIDFHGLLFGMLASIVIALIYLGSFINMGRTLFKRPRN